MDAVLDRVYYFADGRGLKVTRTFIDSGGLNTTQVYEYCRENAGKQRFVIKGQGGAGIQLLYKIGRAKISGIALVMLGVDDGKQQVMNRLAISEKGAQYFHFPVNDGLGYDDIYFKGINLQDIAYTAYLIDGDSFALFRRQAPTNYIPYTLRLQILEGNRVSNPLDFEYLNGIEAKAPNGNRIINGVEIDKTGAIVAYWISDKVPNDPLDIENIAKWQRVKAFGQITGAPNILQICHDTRADQYRGVPYLAPVLETLKQLSRYTTAELIAAIIKSFFALFFVKTPAGAGISEILPS